MIIIKDKEKTSLIHLSNSTNVDDYIVQDLYNSTIEELYRLLEELDAKIDTPSEPSEPDEPTGDVKLQNIKYAIIKKIMSTINPDRGFDGMKSVEIDATPVYESGKEKGYQNGKQDGIDEGYEQGKQDGIEEQKSKLSAISITENGTYVNKDGYNKVVVDIETNPIKIQNGKHVELTDSIEYIYPDEGFDCMDWVRVDASTIAPDYNVDFSKLGYDEYYSQYILRTVINQIDYCADFDFENGDKSKLIFFPQIDTSQLPSISHLFDGAYNLQAIPELQCDNVLDEEIRFPSSLAFCDGLKNIKSNLDFSECVNLDYLSVTRICGDLYNFYPDGDWGEPVRTIKFNRRLIEKYKEDKTTSYPVYEAEALAIVAGWGFELV